MTKNKTNMTSPISNVFNETVSGLNSSSINLPQDTSPSNTSNETASSFVVSGPSNASSNGSSVVDAGTNVISSNTTSLVFGLSPSTVAIFPNASPSTILFPTTNTATATTITAFASPTIIAPSLGNESVSGVGANSQIQSIATNFVFSSDLIGPLVTDVPVLTLVSPSTSTDDFADVTTADLTSTISDLTTTSTIDPGVILSPSPSDTASTNSLTQSSGDPSISQNIIRISAGVAGGVVLLILFFVLIKFGLASRRRKAEYERDMDLEDAFANDSNPVRSSIMIPSNAGFYPPSQGFIPLNTAPMMVQNQKYAVPQEQVLRPFEPPQMIHVPQAYGGVGIDSNMPMDGNITGAYALSDEYNRKRNNDNGPAHPSQNNVAAPTSYPTGSTARQHDSYILASTNTSFQRFENNNSTSRDSSNKQSTISPDYDSIKTNSIMPPMNSTGKYMKPISHWSKDSVRLSTNNHPNNKNREQMQDILMRHTSLYSSLDSSEMPMNSKNTSVINGKPITRNSSTAKMESKLIRPPSDVNFNLENLKLMYAISDYKSNLPDELEFSENDLITIYAIYPDGWGYAENATTNQRGMVPMNFLSDKSMSPRERSNHLKRNSTTLPRNISLKQS